MKTINKTTIAKATEVLQRGGVIAYPTEAVYGLGCDPFNHHAITKILQLKHRSLAAGFILVADSWEQLEPLTQPIEPAALYRVFDTWPGPTTWVFPASAIVPEWVRGKHDGIAVRVSNHPIVKALCKAFGKPIVSTSANIKDQPPIRDYSTVKMTFGNQLGMIIEGKVGSKTHPSTIIHAVTGEVIRQ